MRDEMIVDQAQRPSGIMGRMMGEVMAMTNRPRNKWLLAQLDLQPGLKGLEFGFGNGETLGRFLEQSSGSTATGIDWSASMIDAAKANNREALASGRLSLRQGSITDPAFALGGPYDRIWSSNVIQMVDDRPALFARLAAALNCGGLLALCFQPRGPKAPVPEVLADLCEAELKATGFKEIETRWMPNAKPKAFCILASSL